MSRKPSSVSNTFAAVSSAANAPVPSVRQVNSMVTAKMELTTFEKPFFINFSLSFLVCVPLCFSHNCMPFQYNIFIRFVNNFIKKKRGIRPSF